jgi:L-methionine (R)-S-oxide reductase
MSEKITRYQSCREALLALCENESDPVALMASTAALLIQAAPQATFAGFYRALPDGDLLIGPYQGPPACLRIAPGRGVCGLAALERRAVLVADVQAFPGHIACDPASRSELVLPVFDAAGELIGVCDLDSPEPAAFDETDREKIEEILRLVFRRVRRETPDPRS